MSARPLAPLDATEARRLVEAHFRGTRYLPRLLEQLDVALTGDDAEYAGLVADDRGLLLYGPLAGAADVVKLHAVIGEADELLEALVNRAARMIVCEIPLDAPFRAAADALVQRGFVREGRVDAWFSDAIPLDILVFRQSR